MENDPKTNVRECWEKFDILTTIGIIKDSWDEVRDSTLNACWCKVWPEEVNDFNGVPTVEGEVQRIVDLAKQLGGEGFEDLVAEEVEELIESYGEELTTK